MNPFKQPLQSAVVLVAASLAGVPALAEPPSCGAVSPVERRIVERANGEIESLRSFVGLTAIVYGINMNDVRQDLDKWRAAVECRRQVAAARAQPRQDGADTDAADDSTRVVAQR